jgi:hypothetical protein
MKIFNYTALLLIAGLFFTSCEKYTNSAEESTTTYLPKLTMNGPAFIELACGATSYTDEGLTAEEGGQSLAVDTEVAGKYFGGTEVSGSDVYSITYSAVNKDGIPGAAERTVVVPECNGDLVNSIAGMYTCDVYRNGTISAPYQGVGPIIIKDLGGGVYQLSDAIGGYYDFGRGYGYHYAALGMTITANDIPSNDFTYGGIIGVGDFGGELEMKSFEVDAATKTITFSSEWSFGYLFEVTLTQM